MTQNNIPFIVQLACTVKNRWNNDVLLAKGILTKPGRFYLAGDNIRVNRHCIDAVRHAMHAYTYNKKVKEVLHERRGNSLLQSDAGTTNRRGKQKSRCR